MKRIGIPSSTVTFPSCLLARPNRAFYTASSTSCITQSPYMSFRFSTLVHTLKSWNDGNTFRRRDVVTLVPSSVTCPSLAKTTGVRGTVAFSLCLRFFCSLKPLSCIKCPPDALRVTSQKGNVSLVRRKTSLLHTVLLPAFLKLILSSQFYPVPALPCCGTACRRSGYTTLIPSLALL